MFRGVLESIERSHGTLEKGCQVLSVDHPGAQGRQFLNQSLDMSRQRPSSSWWCTVTADGGGRRTLGRFDRNRNTNRAAPPIERIEDIGLAELDANRSASRTLAIVALEVPIDSGIGNLQRHPLLCPTRHLLEGRTDDADQVPVILATEIGFDVATVAFSGGHEEARCARCLSAWCAWVPKVRVPKVS